MANAVAVLIMITVIGVGHVFDISNEVERLIRERKPTVVCVELDKVRYQALREDLPRDSMPLVFSLLARFQEKMANKYGTKVGQEMLTALDTANKIDARKALIDLDSTTVLYDMLSKMSFAERIKFLLGALGGVFVRKKQVEKELKRFEENTEEYLEVFEKEFPAVKEVLIDRRDRHMANVIRELSEKNEDIVVVIGDGHTLGVRNALSDLDIEVIRLSKVRAPDKTVRRRKVKSGGKKGVESRDASGNE